MKLNVDSTRISIPCPHCSQQVHESIGRLKTNPQLTCTACGGSFRIDADQLRADLDQTLGNLGRTLGGGNN